MTRKRSSQRLESDEGTQEQYSDIKFEDKDDANDTSDGDDVSKLYQRVKSFDKTLSNAVNATNCSSDGFKGRGGLIQEIELFNFMCHAHLKVELKENINFIVGNNGSGKSAILTALTVCLGARASSTQRATSLESLIKEGAVEARVIVKLSNSGTLRFRGDLYGESIIIERRFRRNGPNTFKVKSGDTGRIVSERKDEVVSICDNYNIQVDNPLSILTQETAKKFLVNSTPQDLYAFFSRGTQLEQLSFDYAYSLDRMQSIQNSLDTAEKSWPEVEKSIEKLTEELEVISEQKETIKKVQELKAEIAWTEINNLEKEAAQKEEILEADTAQFETNNENISALNETLQETNATLKEIDTEVTALYSSKIPLTTELDRNEKNLVKKNTDNREYDTVLKNINTEVTKANQDLAEIESKLEESLRDTDTDRIAKKNEIERLEQMIQDNNRKCQDLREQLELNNSEYESMDSSLDIIKTKHENEKRIGEQLAKKLDEARSAAQDKLKLFGENVPEVLKIIRNREREFLFKPIGPIGMYVELKESSWAKPMDAIIGSQLKCFITHDHRDRVLLESILRECRCQNPIINQSRNPIDYSSGEPDGNFLTALRALEIKNEMVKKALIMFSGIERILLISDSIEARKVMMARLRNVDAAYTHTHRITATPNSLAFFAIYPNSKGNPFESGEERVKSFSIQIKDHAHQFNIISRDLERLTRSMNDNRNIESDLKDQLSELKRNAASLKTEIRNLESALNLTDETGTEVLKSEKETLLMKLASLKTQFGDNFESQMRLSEEIEELKEKINSIKEHLSAKTNQINAKKEHLSALASEKRETVARIDNLKVANSQLSKIIETKVIALDNLNKRIEEAFSKVPDGFERVYSARPITLVEREIHRLEKRIEMGQEFNPEDFEKVKCELEQKTIDYEKSKANVRTNRAILDDMKIALADRQRHWKQLRNGIVVRSNNDFSTCLQARDYRGYLEYDHDERSLNINVHIDQIEQENYSSSKKHKTDENFKLSKRDIKQLSGGEKSFGTTCFLLSLWDAMGCPIRCLDEFDVYMDAVNRRLVVEMLINNARQNSTQFILITPVSVRNFLGSEDEDSVHMVVLGDPQRS